MIEVERWSASGLWSARRIERSSSGSFARVGRSGGSWGAPMACWGRRALLIAKAVTRPPETESGQRRERWTHRELGEQVGISESQAHVILSRAEIRPHRTEYWVMTDFDQPYFEERCSEVCGLYLDPPANALVLSIDEKTSIQAKGLARADTLPKAGNPARRDYEYTRNGTM